MSLLLTGLVLFISTHTVRIFAADWRASMISRFGVTSWKGIFSLISVVSFIMIVYGYGGARMDPAIIWFPPVWARHLALLLTVPAFILLAAAYIPHNHIKSGLGHPMFAAVKIWAFSHLLANGNLADIILFGAFLIWAITGFATSRRRDRALGIRHPAGTIKGTVLTIAAGLLIWAAFAFYLHTLLFGVSPLP